MKKEAIEKQHRDPQAHLACCVDTCERPATLPINDYDLSNRDLSQRGSIRPQVNHPEPVQSCGAIRLPHTVWAARIVVKGELHSGK